MPKSPIRGVFMNEDDSQNPFGFLNNSSKQIGCLSSKGQDEKGLSDSEKLKENLELDIGNEDNIDEHKEPNDPIQSAKKSTNVDSNLRNEQILEDKELDPIGNEQFKNFDKEMEPEVPQINRTLENEHPNHLDSQKVLDFEEKHADPSQVNAEAKINSVTEPEANVDRTNRASRKKNPKVFGDEYVTTINGRRRTPLQKDIEKSEEAEIQPVKKKKPGRKRENKIEAKAEVKKIEWTYSEIK